MRNLPEFVVAFWATIAAGSGGRAPERLVDGPRAGLRAVGLGRSPAVRRRRASASAWRRTCRSSGLKTVVVAWDEPFASEQVRFADLVKGDAVALPDVALLPEDPATILYTGGTTGQAEGSAGLASNATVNILGLAFMSAHAALRHTGSVPVPEPGRRRRCSSSCRCST